MGMEAELVLDTHSLLGEGAIWDPATGRLYWVDIDPGLVHVYNPADGDNRTVKVGQPVGTIVPRAKGGTMVALRDGFGALDPGTGALELWSNPEAGIPGNRFNDGKCDPAGRFWAGTLGTSGGALYRLDADRSVTKLFGGVKTSNGIVWTKDLKSMYYIDTGTGRVDAFDYDHATGAVANRRPAVTVPKETGRPDGCTLDAEGMLWVAMWEGWGVVRYNPATGQELSRVKVPVSRVTSVAFGGPDLKTLYITTSSYSLKEADKATQPHAGGLFKVVPGVTGVPAVAYAG